jgi:hypothetical protein
VLGYSAPPSDAFPASLARASEIGQALHYARAAADDFWNAIPTSEFFAPIGDAWSPADNVRHRTKSVRPLAQGLRLPPWVLRLRFGRAHRPSRTIEEIIRTYGELLRAGGTAGRFAPSAQPAPNGPDKERQRLMSSRQETEAALVHAASRWSETNLDAGLLPHPLLGRLTVREMLLFTLYHGVHHARGVARRKGISPPEIPLPSA